MMIIFIPGTGDGLGSNLTLAPVPFFTSLRERVLTKKINDCCTVRSVKLNHTGGLKLKSYTNVIFCSKSVYCAVES